MRDTAIALVLAVTVAVPAFFVLWALIEIVSLRTNTVTMHKQDRLSVPCPEGWGGGNGKEK